ncbi:MAG TPA: type 1 glutamine amidotransferase [Geobacteraceae bacterium]|nr:type 1 glutamine amidotransferase [Geobacteraceae bacterium]
MLVIIQNDPEVPLGVFADYLADAGTPYTTIPAYRGEPLPPAGEVSAVIVLGGAMGVHDGDRYPFLAALKGFIRECAALGIPYLGICLGGQLLADALGARVTSNACGEKGTLAVHLSPEGGGDPLFAGLPQEFISFQWHNDCFDLPAGAVQLASSRACPGQAFRFGNSVYGLQFHPEVDRTIVDCWARWSEETAPVADQFLAVFAAREEEYRSASRRLLRNFITLSGLG